MGAQQVPEDDLERFLSISTELLCILGFDGEIRRVSGAWTSALGYTAEELVSRRAADFAHPQDRAQLTAAFEKLRDGAGTVTFECRLAGRDGAYRRFYWQARAFPPRQVIYAAARDLSDQIRFPEQRYWRLFETSKDGMMIVDAHSAEVLDVNPRVIEMFDELKEKVIGRKLEEVGFFAGASFAHELPRKVREQ